MVKFTSLICCGMVFLSFAASPACAAPASPATQSFIQSATVSNQFEISASRLALQNSQNDSIKAFAQEMIDDHSHVATDMKAAVGEAHIDGLPHVSDLDAAHRASLAKLNDAKGQSFDAAYVDSEIKSHQQAIALFRDYSSTGDNPALRSFAVKTLPILQQHQQDVEKLGKAL